MKIKQLWRVAFAIMLVVAGGLVPLGSTPTAWAAPNATQNSNRSALNFNTHWLFAGEVPGGNGQAVSLDESAFVPVTLPYFRTHPHKDFPRGDFEVPVSWYRRHFALPASYSGLRISVEFQGVAKVADVYVNGSFVGQHKGAYTSFTFDITPFVTIGGADNVIAVKVDSMTRNDIPPEGGAVDLRHHAVRQCECSDSQRPNPGPQRQRSVEVGHRDDECGGCHRKPRRHREGSADDRRQLGLRVQLRHVDGGQPEPLARR